MKHSTIVKTAADIKPLFFHIGWMRTGSTFLQDLLKHETKVNLSLKNRFFSYNPYFNRGSDFYKEQVLKRNHLINIDSDENYSMGRFKTQLREVYDVPYNYKSELGFIYHDINEMVHRMKECAPDAKIFGVIRKQADWFESVYKHDVYHFGLDQRFSKFYESELGLAYRRAADYHTVYQTYVKAFSKKNVKIFLFEDFVSDRSSFIQELSDYLGINLQLKDESILKKNASPTNFFTLFYRYANKVSEKNPCKPENTLYQYARKTVAKLDWTCRKMHITLTAKIIPDALREEIQHQYAVGNQQLAADLHVESRMKKYGYF